MVGVSWEMCVPHPHTAPAQVMERSATKAFQVKGMARAKVLRQEGVWHIQELKCS